jgi:hypothetical protein
VPMIARPSVRPIAHLIAGTNPLPVPSPTAEL